MRGFPLLLRGEYLETPWSPSVPGCFFGGVWSFTLPAAGGDPDAGAWPRGGRPPIATRGRRPRSQRPRSSCRAKGRSISFCPHSLSSAPRTAKRAKLCSAQTRTSKPTRTLSVSAVAESGLKIGPAKPARKIRDRRRIEQACPQHRLLVAGLAAQGFVPRPITQELHPPCPRRALKVASMSFALSPITVPGG